MSAIFGLFRLDGRPVSTHEAERMSHVLAHRGRDGAGVWCEANVGFGHRMVHTTPESIAERLPIGAGVSGLAVTADARIDNRDELIPELGLGGRPASQIADSEIVLAAYERWGEACAARLEGDFVFAIWDRARRSLFLARDPFGTKHVSYYHRPGRLFAFASEIKALFCLPEIPSDVDERSVADHLVPTLDCKTSTFYKDISRLPAGQCMRVDASGVTTRSAYTPDLSAELRLGSDGEYAEAFRERFERAVRVRTRSAFPVGATLSGGLDSSSIACVAAPILAREARGPLHTFSAVWPTLVDVDPLVDEQRFIDAVHATGGMAPHPVRADRLTPLTFLDEINWHLDGVLAAPNIYATWAVLYAARREGVRSLFHGTDGDTTVRYGYSDLTELARRGRWPTLLRESLALRANMPSRQHSLRSLVWKHAFRPVLRELVPEAAKDLRSAVRRRPRVDGLRAQTARQCAARPFDPEFASRVDVGERFFALSREAKPHGTSERERHWNAITCGMFSYLLEAFEKLAGAFSIEVRYPFFDRRLVELCIALPPGQRILGGWTRSILRRAMDGVLPPKVQWRPGKGNLSANVRLLMRTEREALDEVFLGDSDVLRDYVDIAALRAMYERVKAEPLLSHDDAYFMLLVVNLHRWLASTRRASAAQCVASR